MAYTAPKTWAYKETLSSSDMNTYVRDNIVYLKESVPIGTIIEYAGTDTPDHFLLCDGAAISRATYSVLYEKIGVTYGVGDGSTTFNLPNRQGKVGIGKNSAETEFDTLGETGGEKVHLLTGAESGLPVHAHATSAARWYGTRWCTDFSGSGPGSDVAIGFAGADVSNSVAANASSAHNNLQPYIVLNYYIKHE